MHFPDIYPVFHPLQRYNPIMTKLPGRIESAIPMHSVADQNLRGHTPIGHCSVVADEKPVWEKMSPQLHRFRLTGRDTWTVDARPSVTGNFRNFVRVLIWNSRYRQSAALTRIIHEASTAAADTGMSTALRSLGLLDVLSSTPAGPSVARLVSMPVCASSLRNLVRSAG